MKSKLQLDQDSLKNFPVIVLLIVEAFLMLGKN